MRRLEIMAEVTKHLPLDFRNKFPEIAWKKDSRSEGYSYSRIFWRKPKKSLEGYRKGFTRIKNQNFKNIN